MWVNHEIINIHRKLGHAPVSEKLWEHNGKKLSVSQVDISMIILRVEGTTFQKNDSAKCLIDKCLIRLAHVRKPCMVKRHHAVIHGVHTALRTTQGMKHNNIYI